MTSDDYASYAEVYGPGGMADDRDDTYDPEYRDPGGYCGYGTYVGGSGADLMCGWCEDGISPAEARREWTITRTRVVRERAREQELMIARLLTVGVAGRDVLALVEYDNRNTFNPRSRYGRH